jgi:hypothetical protein
MSSEAENGDAEGRVLCMSQFLEPQVLDVFVVGGLVSRPSVSACQLALVDHRYLLGDLPLLSSQQTSCTAIG